MRMSKPLNTVSIVTIAVCAAAVFSLLLVFFPAGAFSPRSALAAEKTLEDLQAELDAKINALNTLTAEQTPPDPPGTLSNRLTTADWQASDADAADSSLSAAAYPLSPVIPLAVSAVAFGALFLCCSLLIHKIRSRIERDDFIK